MQLPAIPSYRGKRTDGDGPAAAVNIYFNLLGSSGFLYYRVLVELLAWSQKLTRFIISLVRKGPNIIIV